MTDTNPPQPVLILVRDLLLSSRITAAANAAGIPFKVIRDPAKLAGQLGDRLIVDLNQPQTISAAADWRNHTGRPVIGFVSHVDAETIAQAKAAGLDRVMARSQFVQQLEMLLTDAVGASPPAHQPPSS
jgi:hypothetical protein